ncbi:MAG: KpsF/GutQ family sugar-phosphate isomerase [Puniceicoccales bacterium]|nr:KpsF/GutQ family sugar-phosphate isomerase [Puniceicoccales bacterium]
MRGPCNWRELARKAIVAESDALRRTATVLSEDFDRVVSLILQRNGKVLLTAVGKSSFIAQKIAATLTSTGTQSLFVHPTEALHGDLGILSPGDPTILLSRSGSSDELLSLVPLLRHLGSTPIALVGKGDSPLARRCDYVLEAFAGREADPLGLVPTSSAVSALAVGDALVCALMAARNFRPDQFSLLHPGGQLGRNLLLRVADVLHPLDGVACLAPAAPVREVIMAMTEKPLGACCTVDGEGKLLGIITDGDIRRLVQRTEDLRGIRAADIHSTQPRTVRPEQSVGEAVAAMESGPSQVSVLPVIGENGILLGLVRIHDTVGAMG